MATPARWWMDYLITMPDWQQWHYAERSPFDVTRCGLRYDDDFTSSNPKLAAKSAICPTCDPKHGRGVAGVP